MKEQTIVFRYNANDEGHAMATFDVMKSLISKDWKLASVDLRTGQKEVAFTFTNG